MFESEMNLCFPLEKRVEKLQNSEKAEKFVLKRKIEEPLGPSKKVKIEECEDTDSSISSITNPFTVKKIPFVHHSILPYSTYRHPSQFETIGNYKNLDEITAAFVEKRKAEQKARENNKTTLFADHSLLSYSTYRRPDNFDKTENVLLLEDIATRLAKRRAGKDTQKAVMDEYPIHFTERSRRFIDENGRPKIRVTFIK